MSTNPFSKAFNKLKQTLSRKHLNEDNISNNDINATDETLSDFTDDSFSETVNARVQRGSSNVSEFVVKRIENNRKKYEELAAKGHVYQDVRDCSLKSLFNYVICASIKPSDTLKENVEKLGEAALSTSQKSSSLGSEKKSYVPYIIWKFPEEAR